MTFENDVRMCDYINLLIGALAFQIYLKRFDDN